MITSRSFKIFYLPIEIDVKYAIILTFVKYWITFTLECFISSHDVLLCADDIELECHMMEYNESYNEKKSQLSWYVEMFLMFNIFFHAQLVGGFLMLSNFLISAQLRNIF